MLGHWATIKNNSAEGFSSTEILLSGKGQFLGQFYFLFGTCLYFKTFLQAIYVWDIRNDIREIITHKKIVCEYAASSPFLSTDKS